MNIVVCIKHVMKRKAPGSQPCPRPGIMNPGDRAALRAAVHLAGNAGEVTALTMGPPGAEDTLREALALGARRAVLVCDARCAESDTLATSYVLGCAVKKLGNADVVICGTRTIDSDTGHVGPQLSELLDIPLLPYMQSCSAGKGTVRGVSRCDGIVQEIEADCPCLITVDECGERVYPPLGKLGRVFTEGVVERWDADMIGADTSRTGRDGSPTWVRSVKHPERKRAAVILHDKPGGDVIGELLALLKERDIMLRARVRSDRGYGGYDA
ncbi:MAG TPA: electron transfer flavoprotein subunit beta/FixA family protein [Spirochaetota bacterium]|nr:electron transfer flavoprotein subunit beta/FixA family protein [Spirochaetota bacterium]